MAVTGPDFISLQVRDLERSAAFYEQYLGLKRSDAGPPHAVVFDTKPIAFAVRDSSRASISTWFRSPGSELPSGCTPLTCRPSTTLWSLPVRRSCLPRSTVRSAARSLSPTPMATRSPFTTVAEPTILVFGATGALGGHVLEGLIARGVAPATVTAAGRNPSRLAELGKSGFAMAKIDMSDSARVADVVAGHRRVVLISGRDPNRLDQHTAVIKAATKAQVEHVYYTSGLRADDVRFEIGADHKATEDALIASGVTYTILRNGWYIENYIQAMAGPRYTGILAAAVGDAVIAPASRRDLADALAAVVMTDGHDNVTYNLSGDTDFTYADIAQAMSIVLEREVSYTPVTPDELRSMLVGSGMGEAMAGFLVSLDEPIAAGMFAKAGDDLTRLTARPTTTLVDGLTGR